MKIDKLLNYALNSGASDLHLSVGSIPMVRINGTMKPLNMAELVQEDMLSILPQVMNDDQIRMFNERKEIDFSARILAPIKPALSPSSAVVIVKLLI